MAWLLFYFTLETGVNLTGAYSPAPDDITYYIAFPMYIQFTPEFYLGDNFRVYGTARVDMFKTEFYDFIPVRLSSFIGAEFYYDIFTIGTKYECVHGIVPWENHDLPGQQDNQFFGQIYIQFTNKPKELK